MVKHIELRRDVGLFERRKAKRGKWGGGGGGNRECGRGVGKERGKIGGERGRKRERERESSILPLRYSNMRYNFPSV